MDLSKEPAQKLSQTLAEFSLSTEASAWVSNLISNLTHLTHEVKSTQLKNQALVLELAHLRRMRFGKTSEAMHQAHGDLFDETLGSDIGALEAEMAQSAQNEQDQTTTAPTPSARTPRQGAGRQKLPAHLPRIVHRHDLPASECSCSACGTALTVISEDVSEQLDVTPASFFVHQHIRPQYACKTCECVSAAAVPPAVIDGGMAAPGLISWVLTSKFADHLPLYRLEQMAARSNVNLARSTLAQWVGCYGVALSPLVDRMRSLLLQRAVLHADETPVQQLVPGLGKTKRAYLWAYCSADVGDIHDASRDNDKDRDKGEPSPQPQPQPPPIVIFDYQTSRAGAHARSFLEGWHGHLMCDDYTGYKALFESKLGAKLGSNTAAESTTTERSIIELGCMAHARRKFFDLHAANGSPIALEALTRIAALYEIEARVKTLPHAQRQQVRMDEALPKLADMKKWLIQTRANTANGGALAKAIDYSLRRWEALLRYAKSGDLPIDNNLIENAIRPIAIGKKNWLFAGSERAGKRAAAIQSLFATAKRNGLDPAKWLTDVITKLPTHPNSRIEELVPFRGYRFESQTPSR
jgi:transposase